MVNKNKRNFIGSRKGAMIKSAASIEIINTKFYDRGSLEYTDNSYL